MRAMRAALASMAATSLLEDGVTGADGDAEGVPGPRGSALGSTEAVTRTVGTGCGTAGDGDCSDEVASVRAGIAASGGCVVELDGGVLRGVDVPAEGALDALGTLAGEGIFRSAPRPSILPVA